MDGAPSAPWLGDVARGKLQHLRRAGSHRPPRLPPKDRHLGGGGDEDRGVGPPGHSRATRRQGAVGAQCRAAARMDGSPRRECTGRGGWADGTSTYRGPRPVVRWLCNARSIGEGVRSCADDRGDRHPRFHSVARFQAGTPEARWPTRRTRAEGVIHASCVRASASGNHQPPPHRHKWLWLESGVSRGRGREWHAECPVVRHVHP